nr:CcdB family protein [Pantoea allii]
MTHEMASIPAHASGPLFCDALPYQTVIKAVIGFLFNGI